VHSRLQSRMTKSAAEQTTAPHARRPGVPAPAAHNAHPCACGGTCPHCAAQSRNVPVSERGDATERQAERMASSVARHAASDETPSPLGTLARNINADPGGAAPGVSELIRSGGKPLDGTARADLEPRFGVDFGAVQVHTDARAATSAAEYNARAYTFGRNIVFGENQYQPSSSSGRHLLAHELSHVVQQTAPAVPSTRGDTEPTTSEIQTRTQATVGETPLVLAPMIQGDFAIEPPRPAAVGRVLTPAQMQAALTFDRLIVGSGADRIHELRDVLGVSPDPAVIDEDFVNAVVQWQAMQRLTQDGKLGPTSAAPLFREIGAELAGEGRVKTGPTYRPSGTIAPTVAGANESAHFRIDAEFDDDPANGIFASCCEIRQFIRWDATAAAGFGAGGVPHAGFPAGTAADTWIEDRDAANKRYGHRSGPFTDPQDFDQYIDANGRNQAFGHIYRGSDTPGGPVATLGGGVWRFMVKVVDVCKGGRTIATQDFNRIPW
jgi:hypothetical protein